MWAVLAVELVNPVAQELWKHGQWKDCSDCQDAFSSVWLSTLSFFKTTVAGDSWGLMAVPVIKHSPPLACIFVGASLTIVYGVLTLSNAVVVDSFAEQRQQDEKILAEEMELEDEQDIRYWRGIFEKLDEDKSGAVDLDELMTGAKRIPNFRNRLRLMDIDEQDLEQLFGMLDADEGGTIDPDEFITALSRWRVESKTAARFTKYNMMRMMKIQEDVLQKVELMGQKINKQGMHNAQIRDLFEKQMSCASEGEEPQAMLHHETEEAKALLCSIRPALQEHFHANEDEPIEQPRQSRMQRTHQEATDDSPTRGHFKHGDFLHSQKFSFGGSVHEYDWHRSAAPTSQASKPTSMPPWHKYQAMDHIFSQIKQLFHQLEQDYGWMPTSIVRSDLDPHDDPYLLVARDRGQTVCSSQKDSSMQTFSEKPKTTRRHLQDHESEALKAVGAEQALQNVHFHQLREPVGFLEPVPVPCTLLADGDAGRPGRNSESWDS